MPGAPGHIRVPAMQGHRPAGGRHKTKNRGRAAHQGGQPAELHPAR